MDGVLGVAKIVELHVLLTAIVVDQSVISRIQGLKGSREQHNVPFD